MSAVLLLFALIPLAGTIQVTENKSYSSTPLNCQPVQDEYPTTANAGQTIVITTTVSSPCITVDYTQVVVNILLPNTSILLSTAPAISNEPAINTVRAPAKGGPWILVVQVLWIDYPIAGTLATYQTTITIEINGPSGISTATSSRIAASSTVFSHSTVTLVKVSSSTVIPISTVIPSKNFTSTSVSLTTTNKSTFNTSTLPSNPSLNIPLYSWLYSTDALILAVLVVVLILGIFALKRRRK